ncbi:MAG: tetratricopeptide repeat protein, partial [Propionivibrio sp.]
MINIHFRQFRSRVAAAATSLLAVLACTISLQTIANATPQDAAVLYEDALGRFEKNDVAGAIIQLKNALQQDQKMLAAHLLLGKALLRNGDLKAAEAAFEEAQSQGVSRAELVLPLGSIYLALGRPQQVIERIPASGLPAALQVEVLTMRGNAYVEAGNAGLATQSFAEARQLDPTSVSPLIAEIPMLISAGELAHARANADQAVAL